MTAIIVVTMFIIMIVIDWMVRRNAAMTVPAAPEVAQTVRTPEGIFFAPNHTWLNLYPSGSLRIGVSDFITRLLADPRIVLLKKDGEHVHEGEPFIEMKQNGHHLTVRSPIDGIVINRNEQLISHPDALQNSPFNSGWAYTIQPSHAERIRDFFIGEESRSWISREFARLKDMLTTVTGGSSVSPVLMQDGGSPVAGLMRTAPDELWDRIDAEFLDIEQ